MKLTKTGTILEADPKRVLLLPFNLGNELRIKKIIDRIMGLTAEKTDLLFEEIKNKYKYRHHEFENKLSDNYSLLSKYISQPISRKKELLIGAFFSKEYSICSAALFNPSIVPHPDQTGLKNGELRFILSLRAVGEGHISSVEFVTGIITESLEIILDQIPLYAVSPFKRDTRPILPYDVDDDIIDSNYDIEFSGNEKLSERVIFPFSKTECNGIEDVRLVKFLNDDGSYVYYGTFTAYDGHRILSELLETEDFKKFKIRTLTGNGAKDKGMALFPEEINGKIWMISRQDGENIYIMNSYDIYEWNNPVILREPEYDWEFVQLGNCGSPVKTPEGWLVLTHSVGPLRTYVISAILLDLNNPNKLIGHLKEPLLIPDEEERNGYVPNVVYTCGSMVYNNNLIIPYAMSDSATSFAHIPLNDLLNTMQ
ncbi:MAG: glycoside hydrolase family 130 protein [Ignavibacteriaceae bacterium]|nr:glycoside hydrolase family 130 protein [Ignavibacteriaceae bacterium]